jgi:hypothetical protein
MIMGLCVFALFVVAAYRSLEGFRIVRNLPGPQPDPDHVIAAIDVEELDMLNDLRAATGRRPVVFTRQSPAYQVAPATTRKRMQKRKTPRSFAGIKGPIVPVCQLCPVCRHETILHVMPNAMKANCIRCGIIELDVAAAEMKAVMRRVDWQ